MFVREYLVDDRDPDLCLKSTLGSWSATADDGVVAHLPRPRLVLDCRRDLDFDRVDRVDRDHRMR